MKRKQEKEERKRQTIVFKVFFERKQTIVFFFSFSFPFPSPEPGFLSLKEKKRKPVVSSGEDISFPRQGLLTLTARHAIPEFFDPFVRTSSPRIKIKNS